jgi:hypothetical protein
VVITSVSTPRSSEYPMAFTEREFMRGALWAWGMFLILYPLSWAASLAPSYMDPKGAFSGFVWGLSIGSISLIVAGPIGLVVMALCTWPFRWIGRALQRVRSFTVQLLLYCAIGTGFGLGAAFISETLFGAFGGIRIGIAAGAAIPLGWLITARRALRDDRRPPATRLDADAAFEDSALDA